MKQDQDGHDLTVRHLKLSIPAFFVCLFEGLFLDCFIKKLGEIIYDAKNIGLWVKLQAAPPLKTFVYKG